MSNKKYPINIFKRKQIVSLLAIFLILTLLSIGIWVGLKDNTLKNNVYVPELFNTEPIPSPSPSTIDLSQYIPNYSMLNYYLWGKTVSPTTAAAANWFEKINETFFYSYNSKPPNKCHWDKFSWANNRLAYYQTHDNCWNTPADRKPNDVIFDPPIIYFSRYWDPNKSNQVIKGSVKQKFTINGQLVCEGTNTYINTIVGWSNLTPTYKAIHFNTKQKIVWTYIAQGHEYQCNNFNWEENWFLGPVPIEGGGEAKAYKRNVGGNSDLYQQTKKWEWDVWFEQWKKK